MRAPKLMAVCGLAVLGGVLMMSNARARSSARVEADFEKSGPDADDADHLLADEFATGPGAMFARVESDADGFVSNGELAASHSRLMPKPGF